MAASVPPIGLLQAVGLLVSYCLVYVVPFYLSPATRPSPTRSRDAPESIRPRIRSVSFSTAACSLVTFLIYRHCHAAAAAAAATTTSPTTASLPAAQGPLHAMGYWPFGFSEAASALLLTAMLFAAPLYERLFIDGAWKTWSRLEPLADMWADWATWRNMVAGPVTEECLFRSAAVPLLQLSGSSLNTIIFLSPLVFGLAHLHHFYEFRVTHPQTPLAAAIARSLLQLTYTSLFGAYATFLFLRTGSVLAVIVVHAFCNVMGLPRVWGLVEPYWLPVPTTASGTKSAAPRVWTAFYYLLLTGGAVAWWQNLLPLTKSTMALASF